MELNHFAHSLILLSTTLANQFTPTSHSLDPLVNAVIVDDELELLAPIHVNSKNRKIANSLITVVILTRGTPRVSIASYDSAFRTRTRCDLVFQSILRDANETLPRRCRPLDFYSRLLHDETPRVMFRPTQIPIRSAPRERNGKGPSILSTGWP